MDISMIKHAIAEGKTYLGIELGSTRIKAVLVDENHMPIALGSYNWENQYIDKVWTYTLEDVWKGIQECYAALLTDVKGKYDITIKTFAAVGISAMMHGYLAFDKEDRLLVPFRTWRNTITEPASKKLTEIFQYNIPQRWSIAHLYQAVLNGETHLPNVNYITTLSGYVHWVLTGEKIAGIGDASGMFPIDCESKDYNQKMVQKFDMLIVDKGYSWKLRNIMPKVMVAGEVAGFLTETGAKMLDVSGQLKGGIPVCAPEGDAGTGMVATNSVAVRTGNISAGTSTFAMLVLEKELSKVYMEIDMVTTPSGNLVAMAHANNCTSDLNAWMGIFNEFAEALGITMNADQLFSMLYNKALEGETDCGGLLSYCFFSGENMLALDEGRPMFVRMPEAKFNLANFMRTNLYSALSVLKIGMDILLKDEKVQTNKIQGHGGLFKTRDIGQQMLAAALDVPIAVMDTAGEGGAWGIALLAAYMQQKDPDENLENYLENKVFANQKDIIVQPDAADVQGFETYSNFFNRGLAIEQAAIEHFNFNH